ERDPRRVHRARAGGLDAWPRDREAVRLQPELGHQVEVRLPTVVVVVGHVARVAVPHLAGCVAEGVPDRGAAPVFPGRTFDLVRGGGGADEEIGRELESAHGAVIRSCGHHGISAFPSCAATVSLPGVRRNHPAVISEVTLTPCSELRTSKRASEPSGRVTRTVRSVGSPRYASSTRPST